MSREIKFRAWDDAIIHIMPQMAGPFMIKDSVLASYANINAPLMQYTGLKDKNGVEIYEGDIVLLPDQGEYSFKAQVKWGDYEWYMDDVHFREVYNFADIDSTELEVIGNIYENSELLK